MTLAQWTMLLSSTPADTIGLKVSIWYYVIHSMMLLLRDRQPTSSRLLSARLIHRHGRLSVIVAYAPTEDAADADKDAFYNDLASVIESVPTHDNLLMLGDFSAVTGPRSAGYEDVVGLFGAGNPNNNSSRLWSLCSSHGLIVFRSWFRRLNVHRWTRASDDGRTKKEIDHIIYSTVDLAKSFLKILANSALTFL